MAGKIAKEGKTTNENAQALREVPKKGDEPEKLAGA